MTSGHSDFVPAPSLGVLVLRERALVVSPMAELQARVAALASSCGKPVVLVELTPTSSSFIDELTELAVSDHGASLIPFESPAHAASLLRKLHAPEAVDAPPLDSAAAARAAVEAVPKGDRALAGATAFAREPVPIAALADSASRFACEFFDEPMDVKSQSAYQAAR